MERLHLQTNKQTIKATKKKRMKMMKKNQRESEPSYLRPVCWCLAEGTLWFRVPAERSIFWGLCAQRFDWMTAELSGSHWKKRKTIFITTLFMSPRWAQFHHEPTIRLIFVTGRLSAERLSSERSGYPWCQCVGSPRLLDSDWTAGRLEWLKQASPAPDGPGIIPGLSQAITIFTY